MMRTPEEILSDVCIAFDTTFESYMSRSAKKSTDKMSLITQAFILIMLNTTCINASELSKLLNRTPSSISIMKSKAEILMSISKSHSYAEDFRNRITNSCQEGTLLTTKYYR